MNYLDLHCDTPLELYRNKAHLAENELHISLKKASAFEKYIQCAAVWSDSSLSDGDCLRQFYAASEYFKAELEHNSIPLIKNAAQLEVGRGAILTVEGARLICGECSRIDGLAEAGVRIVTLVWKGEDSIGGAWDTDEGLTPLGRTATEKCLATGIIPDISHGSARLAREVLDIMNGCPVSPIATHSNSFGVCSHRRNLEDSLFSRICDMGGVCGISFCPEHLSDIAADTDDIFRHIDRYISLGGKKNVCFGCDFDGISTTPDGIEDISSMEKLFSEACRRYGADTAEDIFYLNAYNYLKRNLPSKAV